MGISSQPRLGYLWHKIYKAKGTGVIASDEAITPVPFASLLLLSCFTSTSFFPGEFCNFTKSANYVTVVVPMVRYIAVAAILDAIHSVGEIAFTVFP